jgi:hypothetical protein
MTLPVVVSNSSYLFKILNPDLAHVSLHFDSIVVTAVSNQISEVTTPGVWYLFESLSMNDVSLTLTNATYSDPQVSIFSGESCDGLTCVAGDIAEVARAITWSPESEGALYYIFINGFNDSRGDFEFVVSQEA